MKKMGLIAMVILVSGISTSALADDFVCNSEALGLLRKGDRSATDRFSIARDEAIRGLKQAAAENEAAVEGGKGLVLVNQGRYDSTALLEIDGALQRINASKRSLEAALDRGRSLHPCIDLLKEKEREMMCQVPAGTNVLSVHKQADSVVEVLSYGLYSIRFTSGDYVGTEYVGFPDGAIRITRTNGLMICVDQDKNTVWTAEAQVKNLPSESTGSMPAAVLRSSAMAGH